MVMEWIWLGVIFSLILVELVSLNFTAIWFVISGIVSYILLNFEHDYIVQVIVFLVIGISCILFIRPLIIDKIISKRDKIIDKLVKKHRFFNVFVPSEIKLNRSKNIKNSNIKKQKNNKNSKKRKK